MSRFTRTTLCVALIGSTAAAVGGLTLADGVNAVADSVVAGVATLQFGDVCAGGSVAKPVRLDVARAGATTTGVVFANSQTLTVSSVATGPVRVGTIGGPVLDSTWTTSIGAISSTQASVSIAPASAGPLRGSVNFTVRGLKNGGGTLSIGRSVNVAANVVVCDTVGPTIDVPASFAVEASSSAGAVVDYQHLVAASDPSGVASLDCAPASGVAFPLGRTQVRCAAQDLATPPNGSTAVFDVVVGDSTPPSFSVTPSDIGSEALGASGTILDFDDPLAVDAVDGAVASSCSPASGSTFPLGATSVSCSASDAAGNTATIGFQVVVADTTAPVLVVPTGLTAEASGPEGAVVLYAAAANDVVGGPVDPVCAPLSGDIYPFGPTPVSCSATDAAGNRSAATFVIDVVDSTAPALTVAGSFSVEATSGAGAVVDFAASAADLVDGPVVVDCLPSSGSFVSVGATTVQCSAADDAGNVARAAFDVTVVDTTAPALTLPADSDVEASSRDGAAIAFEVSALDAVDGVLAPACTSPSGARFPLGITLVECSVADAAGNTARGSFSVTVSDTTSPRFDSAADLRVEATGPGGALAPFAVTANDAVDGAVAATCDPVSGTTFPLGTTSVACSATDRSGNTATASFDVAVVDSTAPALALPANVRLSATSAAGATLDYAASASDLVDGTVPVSCTPAAGSTFPMGATTVSCAAVDRSGNQASGSFAVMVGFEVRGFRAPVSVTETNVVRAGSTVPLKFTIAGADGQPVPAAEAVLNLVVTKLDGRDAGATTTPLGPDGLRIRGGDESLVVRWKTPRTPGNYRVEIEFVGGATLGASFRLTSNCHGSRVR